ncbi:MAG TPA: hypothetical protein VGP70_02890 [Actinomadura sp.]|nr:hypothetical protein [Actinomadura sp.]
MIGVTEPEHDLPRRDARKISGLDGRVTVNVRRRPGAAGLLGDVFRHDRLTGQVAIGLVGALSVSAVVFGVGMASATYRLSDVGAWLNASSRGMVVHANGLAGKVDGKTNLIPGMRGHDVRIVQDGSTVLIVDQRTGVVSRIDPAQLKIDQSRAFGATGLQVAIGHGSAYAIDPAKGTVQRIDPVSLAAVGGPATLTAPLGQAAIDGKGTLWVPVPALGQVVPFQGTGQARPVVVGKAGDALALTIAAGSAVVTDSTAATATIVDPAGPRLKVSLPSTVAQAGRGGVLFPAATDGQVVPLLARRPGVLVLLNSLTGGVTSVRLKLLTHRFGPPQMLGSKVYIPDQTAGRLHIYDWATNRFEAQVPVTGRPGALETFVKEGLLWVDDPHGEATLALDPAGAVRRISKYAVRVPGGRRRPIPTQARPGGDLGNPNDNGARPNPVPTRPVRVPAPWEAPTEPMNVSSMSGDGRIIVSFQPSAGGKPLGYVLKDPQGLSVSPRTIRPGATGLTFTLTGGTCGKEYAFRVAVRYRDQNKRQAEKLSAPSPPARPCVVPGQPSGFTAAAVDHGANLSWQPATGRDVTYQVSGPTGSATVSGTTHGVTGLTNNRQYQYTLRAQNGAGTSAPLSTTADLTYPRGQYQNANNDQTNTLVRSQPNTTGQQIGSIPQGQYIAITVICQVRGGSYHETQSNRTSDVWNRIVWNGGTGYLNETLMTTPKGGFPNPPLFQCDD